MIINKFDYFRIKDECRKGFLKDLSRAISVIPVPEVHSILDIGCGTGVPTLWMDEHLTGSITAVDSDGEATGWLEEKIKKSNLNCSDLFITSSKKNNLSSHNTIKMNMSLMPIPKNLY